MKEGSNIPDHWQVSEVKSIAESIQYGYTESSSKENVGPKFLRITDIQDNKVDWSTVPTCKIADDDKKKYLLREGDLLFARTGATVGKSFLIQGKIPEAVFASYLIRLRFPKTSFEKFVYYFFQSTSYWKQISEGQVGIGQPNVNGTKLGQLQIPLPPLPEQHAIVSKIEELFSELENGKQQLQTALQQLKVYRQSLLKGAFEGKLTNKNVKAGELPKGWTWKPFGSVVNNFDGKRVPLSRSVRANRRGEYRYYGATEIVDYIDDYLFDGEYILIGEDGANLLSKVRPLAFIVTGKFWVNNHAHILKSKEELSLKYLCYYFNSLNIAQYVSGSAQPKLNQANMNKIPVPICSLKEQELIVQELESKLTVCDKIEETITHSLQQAETLRQSILKKSFEGKLVAAVKEQQETKVIPLPVQEFPGRVSGITETDLQAGIISMVIDLHQKHSKHADKLNHVKCEKISDLVERKLGISLGRVAVKDAAGPDDYKHLKKVEHRAEKASFFSVVRQRIGHTYKPKRKMPQAIEKVKSVLTPEELSAVENLLKDFLPFELGHAELVATLFAGWNNLLLMGKQPTDEEIVHESRENWSERKLTIPRENFFKTLEWMKNHDYIPKGKGQLVLKKEGLKHRKTKKSQEKK